MPTMGIQEHAVKATRANPVQLRSLANFIGQYFQLHLSCPFRVELCGTSHGVHNLANIPP